LSNIARTLKEDQALIKTEDRLSRNLDDEDFTERINDEICRLAPCEALLLSGLAAPKVTDDMVIAIDPGDISKKEICKEDGISGKGLCEGKKTTCTINTQRYKAFPYSICLMGCCGIGL